MVQVRTRHTPTFGVARLLLAPGEGIQASPGAMAATSYGVGVDRASATAFRGLAKAWRDAEVFTAPAEGGWVDLTAQLPGDLYVLDLDGSCGWCLAKDGWLAAAGTVALESGWPGFQVGFGGDVGFLVHANGIGPLLLCCYGALDLVTLTAGELITVDPGHLVAYPDTMRCRLRAVSPEATQSVRTGEGLVIDFAGPGQLVTQTRSPRLLAGWLASRRDGRT
jgi:uncharacterized protein (TIGR00266 family)